MKQWEEIRRQASDMHMLLRENGASDRAADLLAAAARITGIRCMAVAPNDPVLAGSIAMLDLEYETIWYSCDVEEDLEAYYQAHEYAHFWLDGAAATCLATDIDAEASEERVPLGVQRIEGYGPRERRECQANVFAREFLLPAERLRQWFIQDGLNATRIAQRVGVSERLVRIQLTRALLTDSASDVAHAASATADAVKFEPGLDPSQAAAAYAERGPFLIDAGPGTGKTRTLVGRVHYLLTECQVPPSAILALTFSNKAAEEIRERVARVAPNAAPAIWMGTFHAFGLELLRKYGERLGLPTDPRIVDPTDAVFLLEQLLPSLQLVHYRYLPEPTRYLRDLLGAISRAKDELVGPTQYLALAQAMRDRAATDTDQEAAERALEVARVYAVYQAQLETEHQLDFSDLIWKSVILLQAHPDVRKMVRQSFSHVLVDEYQDVNRASGVLLKELVGDGEGLWAVGDARQSIYRFRGAAPRNVREFETDFPGARVMPLERNYRSQPAIVNTFATLAPQMQATAGRPFAPWEADRPLDGGGIHLEVASDLEAEAQGIAAEIEQQRANGFAYREQAVLCRSHTSLARLATRLERAGIPVLYLGDLFERPEIRDLLSLVSLTCEPDGRGLLRVARFPEYDVPLTDILKLLQLARDSQMPFPKALALAADNSHISSVGQAGLALLAQHLEGLIYGTGTSTLLSRYLFERSRYLQPLLADDTSAGRQQRMAIAQFLQYAFEQTAKEGTTAGLDPKRHFLADVRRLEIFGEEKQLRQAPAWADRLDAVRLMTIHASKGLEFRVVYLPILGQKYMPAAKRPQFCPPPPGLFPAEVDAHAEEEECLFFVALSRARDVLVLSRAERYGAQSSNASKLLDRLVGALPRLPDGEVSWASVTPDIEPDGSAQTPPAMLLDYEATHLDQYRICPHQYYVQHILNLGGRREDTTYLQFHRSVYGVLSWMASEHVQGRKIEEAAAHERLASTWAQHGPLDHPYETIYRESAREMIDRAVRLRTSLHKHMPLLTSVIPLKYGRVRFTPDHVEQREDGAVVYQRHRTGRISTEEKGKNIYALYQWVAEQRGSAVEIVSLSSNAVEVVNLKPTAMKTRLAAYDRAIAGIQARDFAPKPDEFECPRCAHCFVCPISADTPDGHPLK